MRVFRFFPRAGPLIQPLSRGDDRVFVARYLFDVCRGSARSKAAGWWHHLHLVAKFCFAERRRCRPGSHPNPARQARAARHRVPPGRRKIGGDFSSGFAPIKNAADRLLRAGPPRQFWVKMMIQKATMMRKEGPPKRPLPCLALPGPAFPCPASQAEPCPAAEVYPESR
jgi:hypothetical protein